MQNICCFIELTSYWSSEALSVKYTLRHCTGQLLVQLIVGVKYTVRHKLIITQILFQMLNLCLTVYMLRQCTGQLLVERGSRCSLYAGSLFWSVIGTCWPKVAWNCMGTGLLEIVFHLSSDSGNLARGRPTFASSARSDGTTSGRAVDGVFYESGHAYENCFASEYEESPWWMLQLDRPYAITYVYIMACGKSHYM